MKRSISAFLGLTIFTAGCVSSPNDFDKPQPAERIEAGPNIDLVAIFKEAGVTAMAGSANSCGHEVSSKVAGKFSPSDTGFHQGLSFSRGNTEFAFHKPYYEGLVAGGIRRCGEVSNEDIKAIVEAVGAMCAGGEVKKARIDFADNVYPTRDAIDRFCEALWRQINMPPVYAEK